MLATNLFFKNYPTERLLIDSLYSRLNPLENKLRLWILNYIIDNGSYNINSNLHPNYLAEAEYRYILKNMETKNIYVKDEEGNINFIYPVSALATNHQVTLADGRQFHAMCAVDAMGTAFTFKQDVQVKSRCSSCGETIEVTIQDGQIVKVSPVTTHVMHVDLTDTNNWAGSC